MDSNANSCPCIEFYIDLGVPLCESNLFNDFLNNLECDYKCYHCIITKATCFDCKPNSHRNYDSANQTCPCNDGYFDNGSN